MAQSKSEFQKFQAIRLLKESTLHHFGGFENAYRDGDMTKEEIIKLFTIENFVDFASDELSRAMQKGHVLETPMSYQVMEAKHLKFLGTETLEIVRTVGGVNAWIEFKDFIAEVGETA